jgi:hypothetical protein
LDDSPAKEHYPGEKRKMEGRKLFVISRLEVFIFGTYIFGTIILIIMILLHDMRL